jgi:hypothetical protein
MIFNKYLILNPFKLKKQIKEIEHKSNIIKPKSKEIKKPKKPSWK